MSTAKISLPPKLVPVFSKPLGAYRYRGSFGGRGSGKTRGFALMSAVFGYQHGMNGNSGVILCAREYMNSLEESSMQEVKEAIRSVDWLADYYEIGEKYIKSKDGRISYAFSGLRHNLDSLKSKARIFLCWIDEAEGVSDVAYSKLLPTIRETKSEVWVTWNPELEESPTDIRFRREVPDNAAIVELNYMDNPWFPDVLEQERLADKARLDANTYAWIWEGAYLTNSDRQVLAGKVREMAFEPTAEFGEPLHGLDFGFGDDPTAAVRVYVHDKRLWIYQEAVKTKLDIDRTTEFVCEAMPDFQRYVVRADNARPESISYLRRHGLPYITNVKKWNGSIEDGIAHLRGYKEIVIHPQCTHAISESRKWSYKVDKRTGDVLPDVVDKDNHVWDAVRYAIQPLIKRRKGRSARVLQSNSDGVVRTAFGHRRIVR